MEMDFSLAREIFYIELWHFAALIISLGVNYHFYRKGEKGPLLYRYLAIQGALILWIVSKILKTISPTADIRWFFIVSQYLGVCFLGPLFLLFSWRYTFGNDPPRIVRGVLYAPALFFFLAIATNNRHYLFYRTYTFYRDTFGPLFYGHSLYTYLLVLVSIIICFAGVKKHSRSTGDILIGFSSAIPLFVNFLYAFDFISPLFDITPLTMTGSLIFFGLAAFRSHFLGLLPVARSTLLENLEDPLILTDRKGRVRKTHMLSEKTRPEREIRTENRIYRLHREQQSLQGRLYHYVDVTSLTALQNSLADRNRLLEDSIREIRKQNRIKLELMESELLNSSRRELHDILGHSLTQVIFLLRAALEGKLPEKETEERLRLAGRIIDRSLAELNRSLDGEIREDQVLSIALQRIIEECSCPTAKLEFTVRGRERRIPPETVGHLLRCCQEGITNAMKHGAAEEIYLSLLYGESQLVLILSDTGSGCRNCRPGNGLQMMERRLTEMGGRLRFWSEPEEGFQLTMILPCGEIPCSALLPSREKYPPSSPCLAYN